jgi:hypothetical protein
MDVREDEKRVENIVTVSSLVSLAAEHGLNLKYGG